MKNKILLPLITASMMLVAFTACSDDSSSPTKTPDTIVNPDPSQGNTDPVVDPNQGNTDPVVDPNQGNTDPVVDPQPESSADPVRVVIENNISNNVSVPVDDFKNYDYYGAELSGRDQFTYGRFEARMKMVSIPGSISSMFLYYDPSYQLGDEPWNEIDIEVLGTNPGSWQSNLITRYPDVEGEAKHKNITSEYVTGFGFNSTEDFHLYAMVWTPEYISWEIDSVEIRRDVMNQDAKDQVNFMMQEQTLRFNLWSSKSVGWVGKFTGAELAEGPQEQFIDYVRVYSYDPATKTFAFDWQDDFEGETLDRTHWTTGNWQMENVMLRKENVVVADGYCKLLLSREAKEVAAE